MQKYADRRAAGKILADSLKSYSHAKDAIVLALPRGGVPVAYEVAHTLQLPLDIFIVRKLGVPGHEELAMGAIAMGNSIVFNTSILHDLNITEAAVQHIIQAEKQELQRREMVYRGNKPFPNLTDKTVILIDDGIATGASMRVAIQALKQYPIKKIIVAIPVAASETIAEMSQWVDEMICPLQSPEFYAVGAWYDDFSQTTDEEVFQLLK